MGVDNVFFINFWFSQVIINMRINLLLITFTNPLYANATRFARISVCVCVHLCPIPDQIENDKKWFDFT